MPPKKRAKSENNFADTSKSASDSSPEFMAQKAAIKERYSLEMPADFYDFWMLCSDIRAGDPLLALSSAGLQLVGPFEVLWQQQSKLNGGTTDSGDTISNCEEVMPDYLLHYRFYYDVPEFQTVFVGDPVTKYHIGYFRDDPKATPAFVASNEASKDCQLAVLGDNLFAAVSSYLTDKLKHSNKLSDKTEIEKLLTAMTACMSRKGYSAAKKTKPMKDRDKLVVNRGFHRAGIVVPVSKDGVGYREVPKSVPDLKRMFKDITSSNEQTKNKAIDELQELITYVQFANDECDYGQGLELGLDLFCYGNSQLHPFVKVLLPIAYRLLDRPLFAQIIEVHLENRKQ